MADGIINGRQASFWQRFGKRRFLLPQAIFQAHTDAPSTSLYEPGSLTFVSFFTAACIVVIGTWEQDLKSQTLSHSGTFQIWTECRGPEFDSLFGLVGECTS